VNLSSSWSAIFLATTCNDSRPSAVTRVTLQKRLSMWQSVAVARDSTHSCTSHAGALVNLMLMSDRPVDNVCQTETLAVVSVAMQEMKLAILLWERKDTLSNGGGVDGDDC
jgi:hypothetical protein